MGLTFLSGLGLAFRSMSLGNRSPSRTPPTNVPLMIVAGVLLVVPVAILMWVSLYAKEDPHWGSWPFFYWFQLVMVPITALMTYVAHRLVLAARGQSDRDDDGGRK